MQEPLPQDTIASPSPEIQHPPGWNDARSISLGIHARFVSPPSEDLQRINAVNRRFTLLGTGKVMLPEFRIHNCMRVPTGSLVEVYHNAEYARASFGGLQTCGSVHICPVCGSKIGERRSEEIQSGVTRWLDQGNGVLMATFTLQHSLTDNLASVAGALNDAYRRMRNGKTWQRFEKRFRLVGSITAREYTYGDHGWHPHLHALLFYHGVMERKDMQLLAHTLESFWSARVEALGRFASAAHGVRIQRSKDAAAAEYVAKAGRQWTLADEIAKANRKSGRKGSRTPVQLLEDAPFDPQAAALFQEYAYWTYGKKAIVWTPGLRKLLQLEEEKTDEAVAAELEKGGRLLVVLERQQWRVIMAHDARADLLFAADAGDVDQVVSFLRQLGVTLEPWQLEPKFEQVARL